MKYKKGEKMNEKEFRIELQKAVEVLKHSIVKASDQHHLHL